MTLSRPAPPPRRVLLIEDDEDDYVLTRGLLREADSGHTTLDWVKDVQTAWTALKAETHDICLVDAFLGADSGVDLIRKARQHDIRTPFILLTGLGDRHTDLEAMEAGASDYLVKAGLDAALLDRSIRYAIAQANALASLAARTEELARSNADLERFASVVSHDLKTPLHVISSHLELFVIRNAQGLQPDALHLIERSRAAAMRMNDLLDELLAYARLDARTRAFEPVDCEALVDTVIEAFATTIAETGARVTRGGLPVVIGHPTFLLQVFQNLLGNALKFRGTAPPVVHVTAIEEARQWRFSVRDNGIGLPLEQRENAFEMFRQLHDRRRYPGTGVGLAVCRKIVEHHGGRIWVESTPGQGACFHFTLAHPKGPPAQEPHS